MNLLQIRTKARRKLDETSPDLWSNDELDDYINETYKTLWQIMIDLGYRKTLAVDLLSLTADTREVALPSDFIRARLIEHLVGDVWIPCTYYERYDTVVGNDSAGAAVVGDYYSFAYSFLGDNLILEPAPIQSETDTLRLTYYFECAELAEDDDEPEFPSLYHSLLVTGCCIQAKGKEEMIGGGGADIAAFQMEYDALYKKFIDNINNQTQQRSFVEPFGG